MQNLPKPDGQSVVRCLNGPHSYCAYDHVAPPGSTLNDLLQPGFFDGVNSLRVRDVIEVTAADLSFTATLRCVQRDKDGSGVVVRAESLYTAAEIPAEDFRAGDLEARFSGDAKRGWGIYLITERDPDKAVRDGLGTAAAAVAALKSLAAPRPVKPKAA